MAKQKRENGEAVPQDQVAAVMEQTTLPGVGDVAALSQAGNSGKADSLPRNGTPRRPKRKNATERTYFVVGRPHEAAPLTFIMEAPTVGQCRKRLEMVKTMPAHAGWNLRCVRITYVTQSYG